MSCAITGNRFWPCAEVSQDEWRGSGKHSKAAAQKFQAIISACDPYQPVKRWPPNLAIKEIG